jgi:hypothetical protein
LAPCSAEAIEATGLEFPTKSGDNALGVGRTVRASQGEGDSGGAGE